MKIVYLAAPYWMGYFNAARVGVTSYGTRTKQGSRAYTILASVIDTCRQRGVSP